MAECCRSVCARIYPGLLPRKHVSAMLAFLVSNGVDGDSGLAVSTLLLDAASHDPHLFADQIEEASNPFCPADAQVLILSWQATKACGVFKIRSFPLTYLSTGHGEVL